MTQSLGSRKVEFLSQEQADAEIAADALAELMKANTGSETATVMASTPAAKRLMNGRQLHLGPRASEAICARRIEDVIGNKGLSVTSATPLELEMLQSSFSHMIGKTDHKETIKILKGPFLVGRNSTHIQNGKLGNVNLTLLVPQPHLESVAVCGNTYWAVNGRWTAAWCCLAFLSPQEVELSLCDGVRLPPEADELFLSISRPLSEHSRDRCDAEGFLSRLVCDIPMLQHLLKMYEQMVQNNSPQSSLPSIRPTEAALLSQPSLVTAQPNQLAHSLLEASVLVAPPPHQPATTVAYKKRNAEQELSVKKYLCKFCSKNFSCNSSLRRHLRIHTGERPYRCGICGKRFRDKSILLTHSRIHGGQKPFECSRCSKLFSQKCNLTRHMRVHTGERPFKCQFCTKKFSQKSHLTLHERTHTGERPFSCEMCHRSFAQKGTMIAHMRTHTGAKPFKCSKCPKQFSQKGNMVSHMKLRHRAENSSPPKNTK